MKNLLTKISQEEKNRILEMHSGMKKTIKEQYDDQNGMNWTQNTTMDRQRPKRTIRRPIDAPIDEPIFEEGSLKSILKKHNLLDNVVDSDDFKILMQRQSSEVVQKLLSLLPLFDKLVFLAIVDCESADFSDIDICSLPKISFINLNGTENNFEEQDYECMYNDHTGYMYYHNEMDKTPN
jgi:hypothetical protein